MGDSVYKLSENNAIQIEATDFTSEDNLQRIIAKNPRILLRTEDTEDDNQLHLIQRELLLPGAYAGDTTLRLDHFMVDNNAIPYLVEVKLVSNPQSRREVIGQMFDYASRISFYDSAELREMYMKNNDGEDSPVEDSYSFWRTVSSNLRSGHVKMVFAADKIPNTLKSLIQYLGRCMPDVDVYGVEISRHQMEDTEYLTTNFIQNNANSFSPNDGDQGGSGSWNDKAMSERIESLYGDYAVRFFFDFKKQTESFGFTWRYGSASYINARMLWKNIQLLSIDAGQLGAGIYFNTSSISVLTDGKVSFDILLSELKKIDPNARYTKLKKPVHLRTQLNYYDDAENVSAIMKIISKIRNSLV